MLRTQWYERRKRLNRQRGAAALEAGLIFPLLMMMIFAVIELGMVMSAYSAAANAVRAGGRMASVQGSDDTADSETLERMAREASAIRGGQIQFIIVWEATGPDLSSGTNQSRLNQCIAIAQGLGSPNTTSQGVAGICNIYARPQANGGAFQMARGQLANPPSFYFGCTGASDPLAGQKVDCRWAPDSRETRISPRGTPAASRINPDYVGIYIRVQYRYVTRLFGATRTINDNSITLLEPETFGVTPTP